MSKGQRKAFLLKEHIRWNGKGARGKVPYALDAAGHKLVADLLRRALPHGDDADAHIVFRTEGFQLPNRKNGFAVADAEGFFVAVETGKHPDAEIFKAFKIQQRPPQLACADEHGVGQAVIAKVLLQITHQLGALVTDLGFALSADEGKILTDLHLAKGKPPCNARCRYGRIVVVGQLPQELLQLTLIGVMTPSPLLQTLLRLRKVQLLS